MKRNQKREIAFAKQQKLSFIQLLWELPNYIFLLLSALISNSILVWVDLIDSTNIICRETLVLALSRKLRKNLSYKYNYGTGKLEAIASLCCDVLLMLGLVVMIGVAVNGLFQPQQTAEMLILVVLLKIENVVFDAYILIKQKKNKIESKLYLAEFAANLKSFLFDGALLVIFFITYFFRAFRWTWYISPVFSIAFALVFFYYTVARMRKAVFELLDTTCDEQTQRNILKVLAELYDYYDDFSEVKSRTNADQLLIDIYVRFLPETTYAEIEQFTQIVAEKLGELSPNSVISVVIQRKE
ncbi:MAG: cation transporter [Oscillospiraceae bacterium]